MKRNEVSSRPSAAKHELCSGHSHEILVLESSEALRTRSPFCIKFSRSTDRTRQLMTQIKSQLQPPTELLCSFWQTVLHANPKLGK